MKYSSLRHFAIVLAVVFFLGAIPVPVQADAPGYVIITTDATYRGSRTALDDFRAAKTSAGFDARIVLETEWDTGSEATRGERLRAWLQTNRGRYNIVYVLLIGSQNTVSGDVPMMDLPGINNWPTDFNYAELTDPLTTAYDNRSGIEVMVGRIPYSGGEPDVLDDILADTTAYNNETPYDAMQWRRNVLIPIHPLCGLGHSVPGDLDQERREHEADDTYLSGERLKDEVIVPAGWQYHRIYELDYGLVPPSETTPCSWDSVKETWCDPATRGRFGAVMWITHGCAYHSTEVMDRTNAALLDPNHRSFVFQGSCSNALASEPQNLAYAMLKKGAVTTVAMTIDYGFNINLAIGYYRNLIRDRSTAGEAFFAFQRGQDMYLNLFGDPSARLYRLPYAISPEERLHGSGTETGSVVVTADARYTWTAISPNRWIHIVSGGRGTGDGRIDYYIDPNPGNFPRTGIITVGELTFTINQKTAVQCQFPNVTELSTTSCPYDLVDFDNDGDLDIAVSGFQDRKSGFYRNDGPAALGGVTFTPVDTIMPGINNGRMAWGDFNNDGWMDVFLCGEIKTGAGTMETVSRLYRNEGRGTGAAWDFTEINAGIVNVKTASLSWGDVDGDGDLDLLLTGLESATGQPCTKLYRNDGWAGPTAWNFTDITVSLPPAAEDCRIEWADLDSDGDPDVILVGRVQSAWAAKLYRNDGPAGPRQWNFTEMTTSVQSLDNGYFSCADYDNDGDLDIVLSSVGMRDYDTALYRNSTRSGDTVWTFTRVDNFSTTVHGRPAWTDFDNDGDPDIAFDGVLFNGRGELEFGVHLFRNDLGTTGRFTYVGLIDGRGPAFWGDFDNDLDLDVLCGGQGDSRGVPYSIRMHENLVTTPNTPPAAPGGLTAIVAPNGHDVTFVWSPATDTGTPSSGLSYNLYVGNVPGGAQERSPHADTGNGYRRIVKAGDQPGTLTAWTIKDLPGGRYYWSVQAIDTSASGGPFAAEQTFTIGPTISGRVTNAGVGVAGVSIRGLPGGTVLTDASGDYSAQVPYDWTGTVMPYLAGGTYFTPGQRMYARLMRDEPNQDYAVSGTARLRVQYMTYRTDPVTDTIFVNVRVYNDGTNDVNLKDVSFKYWYSSEYDAMVEKVEIDTAFKMPGGAAVRDFTRARIDPLNPEINLQDRVQTTSFVSGAGVIKRNEYVEVHLRLHYNDWTYKYTQNGDYSFQNKTVFDNTLLIPAYFRGSIVWGNQPQ
jgi:hypothetical protein